MVNISESIFSTMVIVGMLLLFNHGFRYMQARLNCQLWSDGAYFCPFTIAHGAF